MEVDGRGAASPPPQQPAQPPQQPEGCTDDNILYSGTNKRMYALSSFSQHPNNVTDQTLFHALVEGSSLLELADLGAVKYQRIIILKLQGTNVSDMDAQAAQMYQSQQSSSQAISITGNAQSLELMVSIVRKRSLKPFVVPAGLNLIKIWTLKTSGKHGSIGDLVINTMLATLRYGGINYRNFAFEDIKVYTLDVLDTELRDKRPMEIEDEIMKAKATNKKRRTERENMLISVGPMLVQRKKDLEKGAVAQKVLTTDKHYDFSSFIGAAALVCQMFDPVTGIMETFSLRDYVVKGYWVDVCLVLLGSSSLGKTELLRTLSQIIANRTQKDSHEAYYILAGTVASSV